MEIRILKSFLVVAETENITRAASILHITQPSLSRQMMQLEEDLGITLFTRHKHSITLTEEGCLLRRRAEEIVALNDKAEQELSRTSKTISGEITIGCGETENIDFLSKIMKSFQGQISRSDF